MVTPVVTCFLRNRDDVLLLRRSETAGSYRGLWGGVSGFIEQRADQPNHHSDRTPEETARAEISEETGLLDACDFVRAGTPFEVNDADLGRSWQVHPFLFDCDSRRVHPDEESVETEWVPPTEMLRRETVPDLWRAYDRVRPTVETVRSDTEHGSTYISVRALDVLRDRAGELVTENPGNREGWNELASLARTLREARPSMAVLRVRIDRTMAHSEARTPVAVEEASQTTIESSLSADDEAAKRAASLIEGSTVLTLSRSGTVLATLLKAAPERVLVAESRPACEGIDVAETLASRGVDVTVTVDAAVPYHLGEGTIDTVVVGADAVRSDGHVRNKVGTRGAALAAHHEDIPLYVVTAADKILPDDESHQEWSGPEAVYDGDESIAVSVPTFDITPPELVTGVVTEDSVLGIDEVRAVAEEHRAFEQWLE